MQCADRKAAHCAARNIAIGIQAGCKVASPMPLEAPVVATTFPLTSDISSTCLLDPQPLTGLWVAFPNLTRYIHKNISLSNDK